MSDTFEDRQRASMSDPNRSSYAYMRELLSEACKRAQQEAQIRAFELEEWELKHGFHRRLNPERSYKEVTGRDTFAGAEAYTRRDAEDIHD